MKVLFTLEDIHEFLRLRYGLDWQYEVYDKILGNKRQATIEDFDYSGRYDTTELAFVNKHGVDCNFEVSVVDFAFFTFIDEPNVMGSGSTTSVDKDLSKFWIEYMLEAYGEVYANRLFKNCVKNKKRIEDEVAKKIDDYSKKVKQENRKEIKYYEALAEKAMEHMLDSDIIKFRGTI